MLLTKNTGNTLKNITWSQQTINYVHQTAPRKGTQHPTLCYPHAYGFSLKCKYATVSVAVSNMGVVFTKHRSESQWTLLLGCVIISFYFYVYFCSYFCIFCLSWTRYRHSFFIVYRVCILFSFSVYQAYTILILFALLAL